MNSAWFGAHIHASTDGGKNWKLSDAGLEVKCVPETSLKRIWCIPQAGTGLKPAVVYAGGDPGDPFPRHGLGPQLAGGRILTAPPTREQARPGAGGMCLHSIQCLGAGRMVAAISAAGTFRTS